MPAEGEPLLRPLHSLQENMTEFPPGVGCAPQKMFGVLALLFVSPPPAGGSKLCPPSCICYESSDLVDCRAKAFSQVPQGVPHGTWYLDLGANHLTELWADSFDHLWSLRILVLSNNTLRLLQSKAFCQLPFLERLDMSRNDLRQLPPDFSLCLSALRDLWLGNNALERLDPPSLEKLESLEKLDLSHNRIGTVAQGALWGLTRLRHLRLQGNRLEAVRDGAFSTLLSLEALSLGNNSISEIEAESLASLRSLSLLGLEDNRLDHLKFKTLLGLRTAGTHLRLAGNRWVCDCDLHRVFSKLQSVRHLHLDDYPNVTCGGPAQLAGEPLARVDSQLCVAETATVLVITVTVLVTVVAAIVMAEHKRKKARESDTESSDFQEK